MPSRPPRPVIQIVSDGTPETTHVQAPDGKIIEGVVGVDFSIEIGSLGHATIRVIAPKLDVSASLDKTVYNCMCCGTEIEHQCGHPSSEIITRNL
jgi:hypothetical protein